MYLVDDPNRPTVQVISMGVPRGGIIERKCEMWLSIFETRTVINGLSFIPKWQYNNRLHAFFDQEAIESRPKSSWTHFCSSLNKTDNSWVQVSGTIVYHFITVWVLKGVGSKQIWRLDTLLIITWHDNSHFTRLITTRGRTGTWQRLVGLCVFLCFCFSPYQCQKKAVTASFTRTMYSRPPGGHCSRILKSQCSRLSRAINVI